MEITATIDGKVKVVTKESVRRHLKLKDSDGISNLPTTKFFKQLALMGYAYNSNKLTFQKGHFSPQWRFLIDTILHCLSSKKTTLEQFSINIATALICLSTNRKFSFSKLIFDGMGPIFQGEGSTVLVESYHTPIGAPSTSRPHLLPTPKSSFRQETKVPQSSSPPHTNVANEVASTGVDVRHERAATTVTSLDVGLRSDNINKTPSMPHDSPLLRVYTLGCDKGRMQHNELMDLVTQLSNKVVALETDLKQTKKVYGAAYTKLIMKYSEPVSTASVAVTTASVNFSPASPARRVSNDDDITTAETLVYIRRSAAKDKGKGIMTAFEPVQNKTKLQQDQERLGYKVAVRLQEELDEEERQRMAKVHEATQSFTEGKMGKH
nr:synaptobrevin, longin-like domain protein [Tanacetum cinerariifolium]